MRSGAGWVVDEALGESSLGWNCCRCYMYWLIGLRILSMLCRRDDCGKLLQCSRLQWRGIQGVKPFSVKAKSSVRVLPTFSRSTVSIASPFV